MRLIPATLRATVAVSALSSLGLAMILSTPGATDTSLIRRDDLGYEMPEIPDEEDFLAPNPTNGNYYADGDGVQSGDSNQTWIYDYENLDNKGKCWTEVFFVGTTLAYAEWKQIGPDHDCASTASCNITPSDVEQKCSSTTWSLAYAQSIKLAVAPLGLGIELTATLTTTVGQTYQACNSHTDSENCTWDDEKCHSIWGADQTLTVHGFKRLSCPGPGKIDGVLLRPDGNFTVTTINFAIPLPASPYTSCNGTCETSDFTGLLPAIDTAMKPWPTQ
ncbi:hypothetical protein V500_01937 [Pseudogymnoascus sp. VKM F-4518 (FW-2643)]|nr:hypothetical protein V500_01937 [Pseudogymnoascus sp. VKM F-4518 (FW-2643)]